jgi:hypothetical protein
MTLGVLALAAFIADADVAGTGSTTQTSATTAVPKAQCGPADRAETVLQGQVPFNERVEGFKGYNCNLKLTAAAHSSRGDGHWQQFALVRDRSGHVCGYGGPTSFNAKLGTTVVDLTDPTHSQETAVINTPGLRAPGEGLRAHAGRGLLVSAYYMNFPSADEDTHGFDVYDVGTDCRHPILLSSTTQLSFSTAGLTTTGPSVDRIYGHEGAFSPDGNTYWVGDFAHGVYHAIDITNPTHPKYLAGFSTPAALKGMATVHGLSISDDGKRAYATTLAPYNSKAIAMEDGAIVPSKGEFHDGFLVLDISEVQARKLNPKIHLISETNWHDNSWSEMTIPVRIGGRPYLVTVAEAGVGIAGSDGIKAACALGRTPFGMAKIFDIADEHKPVLVKNMALEVNDPKNCALIEPEISVMKTVNAWIGGLFLYDVHMCSVDNRDEATTLACGYFNSGIRVYDIRDPGHAKEIAYYIPPAKTAGSIGFCAAIPILDATSGMLYSNCADSGVVSLKFTNGAWPLPKSSTPPDKQL